MNDNPLWLQRQVEVRAYDLVGTVQLPETMHETIAVLTAVIEHGGSLGARELGAHLLGDGRTAVAMQLLRRAAALGLLRPLDDGQWTTTDRGIEALERMNILVPKTGAWRLCFVDDPLLGAVPLSLEPLSTPSLYDSLQNVRQSDQPVPTPEWLQVMVGEPFDGLLVGPTPPVIIEVAGDEITIVPDPDPLELWWCPTDGAVVLRTGGVETRLEGPSPEYDVLQQVLATCHPGLAWEPEAGCFRIRCEHLEDVELRRGQLDLEGEAISFDPYGAFTLPQQAVEVSPWDDVDAQCWARRRVTLEIDDYQSQEAFAALLDRLGFDGGPSTPDRAQVAAELGGREDDAALDPRYWMLQAPVDWGW